MRERRHAVSRRLSGGAVIATALLLQGCGLVTPETVDSHDGPAPFTVNTLAAHVQCELAKAVLKIEQKYDKGSSDSLVPWLKTWSAKVTLKMIANEKSSLTPSLAINRILPNATTTFANHPSVSTGQSRSVGFGGELTANATRTETATFFWLVSDLTAREWKADCVRVAGPPIDNDFKLYEWLDQNIILSATPKTISQPFNTGGPFDALSNEIQFVITASGNVTPSWTLVDLTANAGGPLFTASRVKTNYLLITMGPLGELKTGRAPRASEAVDLLHSSALIGQSVGSNVTGQPR